MFKKVYSLYFAFCTQPAFYSQSALCILHTVCTLPPVRSLRFTLTDFVIHFSRCNLKHFSLNIFVLGLFQV